MVHAVPYHIKNDFKEFEIKSVQVVKNLPEMGVYKSGLV